MTWIIWHSISCEFKNSAITWSLRSSLFETYSWIYLENYASITANPQLSMDWPQSNPFPLILFWKTTLSYYIYYLFQSLSLDVAPRNCGTLGSRRLAAKQKLPIRNLRFSRRFALLMVTSLLRTDKQTHKRRIIEKVRRFLIEFTLNLCHLYVYWMEGNCSQSIIPRFQLFFSV